MLGVLTLVLTPEPVPAETELALVEVIFGIVLLEEIVPWLVTVVTETTPELPVTQGTEV
jgi:hypothetical protein